MKYKLYIVPFTGFYYSKWDYLLDNAEECEKEYLRDAYDCPDELLEDLSASPEWVRSAMQDICEQYTQLYLELMEEHLGIKAGGYTVEIDSPREYNFRSDRIYATVDFEMSHEELVHRLVELSKPHKDKLTQIIKDNHTSYDGFISFMSNKFDEWESLMLHEDSCYIDYLIAYLLQIYVKGARWVSGESIDWDIYHAVSSDWAGNNSAVLEADGDRKDEWEAFKEKMEAIDLRRTMERNHPVIPGLSNEQAIL